MSHKEDCFTPMDFLSKKFKLRVPSAKSTPRGINEEMKRNIIDAILAIVPLEYHDFWMNLPTNEDSVDLFQRLQNQ